MTADPPIIRSPIKRSTTHVAARQQIAGEISLILPGKRMADLATPDKPTFSRSARPWAERNGTWWNTTAVR